MVFTILFTCIISIVLNAQSPPMEWEQNYGGSSLESAKSISQTSDGGFIVAGYARSNDGDVGGNHGYYDYWLVKTDGSGNLIWEQNYGGSREDVPLCVKQTTDGGFIIAGYSRSNDGDVGGNHWGYDYWLVKTDGNGNLIWEQNYGGSGTDIAESVVQTSDGGYIVVGRSTSTNGDVGGNNGRRDYWLVKTDGSGNLLWEQNYGGTRDDLPYEVLQTSDGGYIIAGYSESNDIDVSGNNGSGDEWVVKTDNNGNIMWEKNYGGSGFEVAYSLLKAQGSGFALVGRSNSTDGDVSGNNGGIDYWLVKIDDNGNLLWEQNYGGSNNELAYTGSPASDGGYILSGYSNSNNMDVHANNGSNDYWLVKTDANGHLIWEQNYGGTQSDAVSSVLQTSDNGFIMAGTTSSHDGDVSGNNGQSDFWLVKIAQECKVTPRLTLCPDTVHTANDINACGAYVNYTILFEDSCQSGTIQHSLDQGATWLPGDGSGSYFGIGNHEVWVKDTNAYGGDTCIFQVVVTDSEAPVITCSADITQTADSGLCEASVIVPTPIFSDNCDGNYNNALHFDGTNDWVSTPLDADVDALPSTTWEAWVRVDVISAGWKMIFDIDDGGWDRFVAIYGNQIRVSKGHLYWVIGNIVANEWTHIAVAFDQANNEYYAYVNGVQSGPYSSSWNNNGTTVDNFQIGTNFNGHYNFFNGKIEEVRVWNDLRSQTEIQDNMHSPLNGNESGLLLYYPMNEGIANGNNAGVTTAPDESNNGNDGSLHRFTLNGNSSNWVDGHPSFDGIVTISNNYNGTDDATDIYPVGTTTITWTANDGHGNTSTCTQEVIVTDDEIPVLDQLNLPNVTDECSVTLTPPTATDNCAGTITATTTDPTTYNTQGTFVVTWNYDDGNGNTNSQTQTVIIDDITPPVITLDCPSNITLCGAQNVTWIAPEATDNCDAPVVSSTHQSGDFFDVGTITVTYDFTDVGGNVTSCSFDITIYPLPDVNITQSAVPDFCQGYAVLEAIVNNAGDLEPTITYAWSDRLGTEAEATAFANGTYTVTVTDGNGCEAVVSTVVDEDPSELLSGYVILAKKEVKMKHTSVSGGGVGVYQANKKAKIEKNSVVNTFVKAPNIEIKSGSTVATSIFGMADVTLPDFIENNTDCDNEIEVGEGETLTLMENAYGKIELEEDATLIVDSPELYVEEIKMDDNAEIIFNQSTVVMIHKDMEVGKNASVNLSEEAVTFYIEKKLEVSEGSVFNAHVYAKKKIEAKEAEDNNQTYMKGTFISEDKIESEEYVNWDWASFCNADPVIGDPTACEGDDDDDEEDDFVTKSWGTTLPSTTEGEIVISPNPTRGQFEIDMIHYLGQHIEIRIFNDLGQLVELTKIPALQERTLEYDLSKHSSSSYRIQIIVNEKEQITKKLMFIRF